MRSDSFYRWLFSVHCDRDSFPRWYHYDHQAEYGCNSDMFLSERPDDAVADAKEYFKGQPLKEKISWVKIYQQHIFDEISRLQGEGQEVRNWLQDNPK